jgi:hypothetical protein
MIIDLLFIDLFFFCSTGVLNQGCKLSQQESHIQVLLDACTILFFLPGLGWTKILLFTSPTVGVIKNVHTQFID